MTRLFALTTTLLGLTACFDFSGERGHLGFLTDARVESVVAWTPASPLARGTRPAVGVGEHLADGTEPIDVELRVSRSLRLEDGRIVGERRGWVEADADGVVDHFRLTWRDAEAIVVGPVGLASDDRVLGVLPEHVSTLAIGLVDARGTRLGFVPDELTVTTDAETEWQEGLLHLRVDEPTAVTIEWGDLTHTVDLEPVDPADLTLHIERLELGGTCVSIAVGEAAGLRVADVGDVVWSHVETSTAVAPCAEDVEVRRAGR